jgi:predicted TIM-barrel fold metal-dependent hydrolase
VKIIDTHQHLIYPERFSYPWTKGLSALEGKPFRLEEYREASKGTGIVHSLFMEVAVEDSQIKQETDFFLELSNDPGSNMLGVIATARPEQAVFSAYLDSILHARLKGLRRILHTEADELSQSSLFTENLARLAKHQLTFDLCLLPRQLHLGIEILRRVPTVQFVLDHCGIPNIKGCELDPWRQQIRDLAKFPNLACKISGLVAYCDPQRINVAEVEPYIEHCIQCFGWDRILFGGDWPVCHLTSTLGNWVTMAKEIFSKESPERQEQFFFRNAQRIYRLMP